jgi:hypothetical protein
MPLPTNHVFQEIRVFAHSSSVGGTPIAAYALAPCQGTIIRVGGVINGAITTSDCSVTVAVNGTALTPAFFTIPFTASAAGSNAELVPTGGNTVNEDDYISFTPANASGATITGNFFAIIRPTT